MAHMSPTLNEEIFGTDPTALISSSYNMQGNKATRVPGGFRLSGSWKSSSGIHHASWIVVGADVPGEEVPFNFFLPIQDATVIDDWYTLGLAGTGSRTVAVEDIFVPEHRAIDRGILYSGYGPGLKDNPSALYRVPHGHIYTIVSAAPALGTGWRFYDEFKTAYTKSATVSRSLAGDRLMLVRLAEARGALSAAETLTRARLEEAYDAAVAGTELTALEIAQGMYDIAQNGKAAMSVASTLFPTLRPNAVYTTTIRQRLYRDLIVARQHGTSNSDAQAEPLAMIDLGLAGGHILAPAPAERAAAKERAQHLGYI
jgi:3-hydroxy-9,10-secoandrosta-1,3,5(10)-triene-9,17-dione monooxygenase